MERAEFQRRVKSLTPRQRQVYDELLKRGPLPAKAAFKCLEDTPARDAGPFLSIVAGLGLVRHTGRKVGNQSEWEALPESRCAEADAAIAKWERRKRRPRKGKKPPASRAQEQLRANERRRRSRLRDFKEAEARGDAHLELIRIRDGAAGAVDRLRALAALIEDEAERVGETGVSQFADEWWSQLPPILRDGIEKCELAYAQVGRLTHAPPLPNRNEIEYDDELVEDGEVILELESVAGAASQP